MKPYFICKGSVRNDCGIKHRTLKSAVKCLQKDMNYCKCQGGYSDRMAIKMHDQFTDAEMREYDYLIEK